MAPECPGMAGIAESVPGMGGNGAGSRPGPEGLVGKEEEFGRVSVPSVPALSFPSAKALAFHAFPVGAARRISSEARKELIRARDERGPGIRDQARKGPIEGGDK